MFFFYIGLIKKNKLIILKRFPLKRFRITIKDDEGSSGIYVPRLSLEYENILLVNRSNSTNNLTEDGYNVSSFVVCFLY